MRDGGTLTVALTDDPDKLDPTLARTLVGRIVFTSLCEKLYDIDANLNVVPQLAAAMPTLSQDGRTAEIKLRQGVKFNDGADFNAAAVKKSLDRHRSLTGSQRQSELLAVDSVDAVDASTVRINLKQALLSAAPVPDPWSSGDAAGWCSPATCPARSTRRAAAASTPAARWRTSAAAPRSRSCGT